MKVGDVYQRALPVLAGLLSDSYRQGLPLPIRRDGGIRLAIIAAPVVLGAREGTAIGVPTHVGEFDLSQGELRDLRQIKPSEFGQVSPPDGRLGFYRTELTFQQTKELRAELFTDLDVLIPLFARNDVSVPASKLESARDFRRVFRILREEPLDPYYRGVGGEFFAWLDRLPREP